jgi:hypothetical protein
MAPLLRGRNSRRSRQFALTPADDELHVRSRAEPHSTREIARFVEVPLVIAAVLADARFRST